MVKEVQALKTFKLHIGPLYLKNFYFDDHYLKGDLSIDATFILLFYLVGQSLPLVSVDPRRKNIPSPSLTGVRRMREEGAGGPRRDVHHHASKPSKRSASQP